MSEIQK